MRSRLRSVWHVTSSRGECDGQSWASNKGGNHTGWWEAALHWERQVHKCQAQAQKWTLNPSWVNDPKSVCRHHSGGPILCGEMPCWPVGVTHLPDQPPGAGSNYRPRTTKGCEVRGFLGHLVNPILGQKVVEFPQKQSISGSQGRCKSRLGWKCPTWKTLLALVDPRHPRKP